MVKSIALLFTLLGIVFLVACQDLPGTDGQYATHDHGDMNRPPRALP